MRKYPLEGRVALRFGERDELVALDREARLADEPLPRHMVEHVEGDAGVVARVRPERRRRGTRARASASRNAQRSGAGREAEDVSVTHPVITSTSPAAASARSRASRFVDPRAIT